jgi:hypothetical protein
MKAAEIKLGTEIEYFRVSSEGCRGIVIANSLSDGDEVIAVAWFEGGVLKVNVNDVYIVGAD